jgi:histidine triad (HIT) family protein
MDFLYRLARTPAGRFLVRLLLTRMTFVLPVSRLRETETLLAFWHPKPAYAFHVILTPKRPAATLAELDPTDSVFLTDLMSAVQSLVREYDLEKGGYRLIVNGGEYQDFPHLHFHLISDKGPKTKDRET